jgi:hypothetical protein
MCPKVASTPHERGRRQCSVGQPNDVIDVIGIEVCKDIGERFGIGVNGSIQHSWTGHSKAFSVGPSIELSPAANSWISAGYNVTGSRDRDIDEARYTRQGRTSRCG